MEKEAVEKVVVMVAVVMEEETAAEVRVVVKEEVEKAVAKVVGYNHSILRSLGANRSCLVTAEYTQQIVARCTATITAYRACCTWSRIPTERVKERALLMSASLQTWP